MNENSNVPVAKVQAAGVAGAVSVLIVFALGLVDVDLTAEVSASLTAVLAFLGGYFKKS